MNSLEIAVEETGQIPLSFALGQSYANLGDALSPVMVTLLSGLPCTHMAQDTGKPRLGAVGTIAHAFKGGEVWIWGTGTSKFVNPLEKGPNKRPFIAAEAARFRVAATRGPVTRRVLGEENALGAPAFGDPVWLLPQFYRPELPKRWKLGVIVHLADLNDRSYEVVVKEAFLRYAIPESERSNVRLINTVTDITTDALRERIDEILDCERLVSTSLHGMVFAESYGIPCLYFSPRGRKAGVAEIDLLDEDSVDLRIIDLYRGLGRDRMKVYVQNRKIRTDWQHLMRSIDEVWEPVTFDISPLVEAFPLPLAPLAAAPGKTVFDHPLIQSTQIGRTVDSRMQDIVETTASLTRKLQFWRK